MDLVHRYESPLLALPLSFTVADILVVPHSVQVDLCKSPVDMVNFQQQVVEFELLECAWVPE